jgi:signal transduction histidine kinase
MQIAEFPEDESERLRELRNYQILDTLPELAFDEIAQLASRICNTPIALISLIDENRQWFKARVGLGVQETHRDIAFCTHAIRDPAHLFVVEDTLQDSRFWDNPLVTGDPNIRFYAGHPLATPSGHALGTLCVIGNKPNSLTPEQRETLRLLGNQVVIQLELRRALKRAAEAQDQFKESERQREDLIKKLTRSNQELEEFAHVASHDLKAPLRVIHNASQWLEEDLAEHLTNDTRETMNMLRGRVVRMEKLLDDLLEYASIGGKNDPAFTEFLAGDALMHNILELLSPKNFTVTVSPSFADIRVARMPLQQILMNLISNAIKHHDKKSGCIEVSVEDLGSSYLFAVKDDGPGIAEQFHQQIFKMFQTLRPRDQVEGSGMGLAMVRKNIEVHGGTLKLESAEGMGSTFRFTWPKAPAAVG